MLFTQKHPCSQCPFRKVSLPGWLGDTTPQEFIETTLADGLMPCHKTVDYENPNWKFHMIFPDSDVQHCAGARIFYRNRFKISRNPLFLMEEAEGRVVEVEKSDKVFKTAEEFIAHHNTQFHRRGK